MAQHKREESEEKKIMADVSVIGAGASGLMSAIAAARAGASVVVVEHTAVSCKKILSTGNGRCNFTNAVQKADCYRSDSSEFVMQALRRFSEKDAVSFFEELGVCAMIKNGYFYPRSGQASAIRDALILEARRLRVRFLFKTEVIKIQNKTEGGYQILLSSGTICAGRCILATGGIAAPGTGSDGSGYELACSLGHTLVQPLPALVPLTSPEPWLGALAGVRAQANVSLLVEGKCEAEDTGEVQFTKDGISGIPTFQVSRFASAALMEGLRVEAVIDFLPEMSPERLQQFLTGQKSDKNWLQILSGLVNRKIAGMIAEDFKPADVPVCELTEHIFRRQLAAILQCLKGTPVRISGTGKDTQAQTTCGGIPLREIGADMQSKIAPGLYFAGEILNVDGICGGYNLQWAWTSGYLAGTSAAKGESAP